jgi:AcrR family transcriptional regulator
MGSKGTTRVRRRAVPAHALPRADRILEAGRHVFAEKGFAGASVDAIAEAAGVAKGTVYLYHASKEALYWATLRAGLEELSREIRGRWEAEPTLKGKLHTLLTTKLSYFDAHRDFFRIYQAEFGQMTQPVCLRKDLRDLYLEQVRLLESAIEAASRRREIRKVPVETAAFVLADLTRGVITRRLMGWSETRVEDDVDFLVDFVWKGLAGR